MSQTTSSLGTLIQDKIEALGLTERELEARTGINRMTLRRRYVSGEFTWPEMVRVAALLDTTPSALAKELEGAA